MGQLELLIMLSSQPRYLPSLGHPRQTSPITISLSLSLPPVGMQLLECQQELAQVRKEKCFATQMVRDTEEALEQAVQHERRAMAEVELLR